MNLQHTDVNILIPVCYEASRKAHELAINTAKKYPEQFHQMYLSIYVEEFNKIYLSILTQFL